MCHLYPKSGRQVKTDLPWEENGGMCFRWGGLIGMQLEVLKPTGPSHSLLLKTTGSQGMDAIPKRASCLCPFLVKNCDSPENCRQFTFS